MPSRRHDGQPVLDVAIVGGGMAGLAACASLKLIGIQATVFDRASTGLEGPWATTARMETLRSPKQLAGPALDLPALTFRAWFEAQFGLAAWDALDKIPRLQWMDYLRWYRRVLGLDVRNGHAVLAVLPRERLTGGVGRRIGGGTQPGPGAPGGPGDGSRWIGRHRTCRAWCAACRVSAGRTLPTSWTMRRWPASGSRSSAVARRRWTARPPRWRKARPASTC